jgi:signal peptidase I
MMEDVPKSYLEKEIKFSRQNKILFLIVCMGLLLGLVLKLFVFEILTVSGESMLPAIKDGERLFVSKCAYGIAEPYGEKLLLQWNKPACGDVVIYLYNNKIVVKRCVAVGGDKLEILTDSEYNYILKAGDFSIPLSQIQYLNLKDSASVPAGYILAIGDNHEVSVDSRTYGFVSERNILGKVLCK